MAVETTRWDIAEHLNSEEDIAAYLDDAVQSGDNGYLLHAISNVARARGMTQVAKDAGITRAGLYKAIGEGGNPSFETISKVLSALGVRVAVATRDASCPDRHHRAGSATPGLMKPRL